MIINLIFAASLQKELWDSSPPEIWHTNPRDRVNEPMNDSTACEVLSQVLQRCRVQSHESHVARVIIPDVFGFEALIVSGGDSILSRKITKTLLALKSMIYGTNISIFCTLRKHVFAESPRFYHYLYCIADNFLSTETFIGKSNNIPTEFQVYYGYLTVKKLQQFGVLVPFRPPQRRYGIKWSRRKLHIEPLHIPPEGEGGGHIVSSSSVSSGTALSCSSSLRNVGPSTDF